MVHTRANPAPPFVFPHVAALRQRPFTQQHTNNMNRIDNANFRRLPWPLVQMVVDHMFTLYHVTHGELVISYRPGETANSARLNAHLPGSCVRWLGLTAADRDLIYFSDDFYWASVEAICRGNNRLRFHNMRALYFFIVHIKAAPFGVIPGWLCQFVSHIKICRPTDRYYQQALNELAYCGNMVRLSLWHCATCRTNRRNPGRHMPNQATLPASLLPLPALTPAGQPDAGMPNYFALRYRSTRPPPAPAAAGFGPCCAGPPPPGGYGPGTIGRWLVRNRPFHIGHRRQHPVALM